MSRSSELQSHPRRLLTDHLKSVGGKSQEIIKAKQILRRESLAEIGYLIGVAHDFGKFTTDYQRWLQGEIGPTEKAYHGFLSAVFSYFIIKKYLELRQKVNDHYPAIAWIVVDKHHGDLKNLMGKFGMAEKLRNERKLKKLENQINNIIKNNGDEVVQIYDGLLPAGLEGTVSEFLDSLNELERLKKFTREIHANIRQASREKEIQNYFTTLFFYSVLLDADKLDAAQVDQPQRVEEIPANVVDKYKEHELKDQENEVNRIRKTAYSDALNILRDTDIKNNRIFSLNLPTGGGKTLTGLSCALHLRKAVKRDFGFFPRIIYSLPFLSIIDQNADVIEKVLEYRENKGGEVPSNLLLKHHHLADVEYMEERDGELDSLELEKSLLLTEGWYSEIVVTTFVQFFHSLITNRNRAARKFHNMINSVIILDEVQSIPHKYWELVNKTLKFLTERFNCWVIFMTATQPMIFDKREMTNLVKREEEFFNSLKRVRYNLNLEKREFSKFRKHVLKRILSTEEDIMVVLNTIQSCKDAYNFLKEQLSNKCQLEPEETVDECGICVFPDLELINLSTHVLPRERLQRIDRINNNDDKRKVIVTTQLIEAGVDISVDTIFRDLAPLDSIIQTGGRCNRNMEKVKEKGIVNVVRLLNGRGRNFCDYIYDPVLIWASTDVIGRLGAPVSEEHLSMNGINEYYNLVGERVSKDESRSVRKSLDLLNFSKISEFNLIEEDLPTITVFIEADEKAKRVRRKIEDVFQEKRGFRRKRALRELRGKMSPYLLSVNVTRKVEKTVSSLGKVADLEDFRYVPLEHLRDWYRKDTGFEPSAKADLEMRIL